jgi:hypothetical protein
MVDLISDIGQYTDTYRIFNLWFYFESFIEQR